jgi:hypothetical protein
MGQEEVDKELTPEEIEEKRKAAHANLNYILQTKGDQISIDIAKGLSTSINTYYDNALALSKRKIKAGSDPLSYLSYKNEGKGGLVNTQEIYDIEKSNTSNIKRDQLYKLFAPQVVENINNGNAVALPQSWDIGAHFKDTSKIALNYNQTSSTGDLGEEQLSGLNNAFKSSMKDRIDLVANNTPANKLFEMFSVDKLNKYETNMSDAEFEELTYSGKQLPTEANTAQAFNMLMSNASWGGRNVGKTRFFDANLAGVEVSPFNNDTTRITNQSQYDLGRNAISQLDLSKPIEDQIGTIYDAKGKNTDLNSYREGVYSALAEKGEKVFRNKEGQPARFVPVKVSEVYKSAIERQKAQASGINNLGDDMNLPVDMKNYVDQYKYLLNVAGDPLTAETQAGQGYKAF